MRKFHLIARSVVVAVPAVVLAVIGWAGGAGFASSGDLSGSQIGALTLLAGVLGGGAAFTWCLIRGRNEVYGSGGATDAASVRQADQNGPTAKVTDLALPRLATVEFEPPPGIAPWEGMVLLKERYNEDDVLEAYFSGLAGSSVIEIEHSDGGTSLTPGPRFDSADAADRARLEQLFAIADPFFFGSRDVRLTHLITNLHVDLRSHLRQRGYWRRGVPKGTRSGWLRKTRFVGPAVGGTWIVLFIVFGLGAYSLLSSFAIAILGTFALTAALGRIAFGVLLPSRSAIGSALTLRTESFRRFLHDSESTQVERALDADLVREYAGWAVALDEVDAWNESIRKLNVSPMLMPFSVRGMWSLVQDPIAFQAKFGEQALAHLAADLELDLDPGEDVVREEVIRDPSGRPIGRRSIRFTTRRARNDRDETNRR